MSVASHRLFGFVFTADLHSDRGRNIAAAAHALLRSGEIDNEWKDTIGDGEIDTLRIAISRTNTHHEWRLSARSTDDDYDRDKAAALRQEVLSALRANAEEVRELGSELSPGGSEVE
jgi:hypothetical protein